MKFIGIRLLITFVVFAVSFSVCCFSAEENETVLPDFFVETSVNQSENMVEIRFCMPKDGDGILKILNEQNELVYIDAYFANENGCEGKAVFSCDDFGDGTYTVLCLWGGNVFTSGFEILHEKNETLKTAVTRAEFAVLAANMFYRQSEDTVSSNFTDASDEDYWSLVGLLKEHGIFKGYEDCSFRASKNLTWIEMVAVISRIFSDKTGCEYPIDHGFYLKDSAFEESIPFWARAEVALAVREGIVDGSCGGFDVFSFVAQSEAEQIIARLSDLTGTVKVP